MNRRLLLCGRPRSGHQVTLCARFFSDLTIVPVCLLALLYAQTALAQLKITFPVSRQIVQRDNNNQANVQIVGSYGQPLDVIEARVVARAPGQGTTSNWTTVQTNPTNGQFAGTITVKGGWYTIEVRGRSGGNIVATDALDRFGVGEVFAIMGHSNAQGSACTINGVNQCPTRVGPSDDRVNVVALDQSGDAFKQYLNTGDTKYLPGLTFSQLTTSSGMAPFAKVPWLWGPMGDKLVARINVPVLLYNAGFGGTNMQQTYWAAYDIPFYHSFVRYDLRMPYANVRNLMNLYVPTTGLRAILVHHGLNDRGNPADSTAKYYRGVIDKIRTEFNKPNLGFFIALDSYVGGTYQNIRSAQSQVTDPTGYKTFKGPDLDRITSRQDRPDGVHYSPSGQKIAGELWADAITSAYLSAITPYTAESQPLTSVNCAGNNQLTLTQPDGYQSIWNTGGTTNSLTVGTGTYSARIINARNKVLFPPAVVVPASVQPAAPTISSSTGEMEICKSSGLTLSSSYSGLNYWVSSALSGISGTLTVTKPGVYGVQAKGAIYGCPSDLVSKTIGLAPTDITLLIQPVRKVVALNDTVSYQLIVQNNSSCDAGIMTLQNRLPDNLVPVSTTGNSLTIANGDLYGRTKMINGLIDQIPAWQSVRYSYLVRPTAAGTYINAAEIMTSANPDVNATPANGTENGEKDEARTELRTSASSSAVFTSPNPNEEPANPNEADLSLIMQSNTRAVVIGQTVSFTLTVTNRGALTATNIGLLNSLPTGLQFVKSVSGMVANRNMLSIGISQILPGKSVKVEFTAQVVGREDLVNKAQINASDQADFDSTPNNGYLNEEDDQASNELWIVEHN